MRKVLFIDRDGTLIEEPPDFHVDSFEKLRFLPGVITSLAAISAENEFELVMVTNQDGLGTTSFPESDFLPVHDHLLRTFENEGIRFVEVCIDRSFEREQMPTRKPGTAMLTRFAGDGFDLANSYVIGDRASDMQLAKNLGCNAIFINNSNFEIPVSADVALRADNWKQIRDFLIAPPRKVVHRRSTNETDVQVELNLDGTGSATITTGISFFDHMLEQVARHGRFDLSIKCAGDLHIDEHHTIEDVAITLGEAFDTTINNKRGMERYGFCLPMDDCLAQVAVDFGGRNWIVWDAEFKREMIGAMPTEMFFHFFKSFSDSARCNLNIKAEGTNEHHKSEAIFKAFAKAIRMAVKREAGNRALPTTKGIL